jgi:hypothetical protein
MKNEIDELLRDAGFHTGWAISDGVLILWEHEQDPPSPLVRPEVQVIDNAD